MNKFLAMKIFMVTVVILLSISSSQAAVTDRKTVANQQFAPASKSELGNKMLNDVQAMSINLRAVQEAFDTSENTANVAHFTYSPEFTAKVRLRVGMRSMIHFARDEIIKSYIVGNPSIFKVQGIASKDHELGIIPNILTVKATYPGADTNLTVITESGRIYNFYLRGDPVDSKYVPHLTVYMQIEENVAAQSFQFETPLKSKIILKPKPYQPKFVAKNIKTENDYLKTLDYAEKANTNYKIYGDSAIAPFAVYDDGNFTYFDFRHILASDRLPVVYKVVDKYDTIVNFRMQHGFLVAESLSPEGWTLRNGRKTVCVKSTKDIGKVHGQVKRPQMNIFGG